MKIKHLLLGLALVAIMASCSKKADTASTTTEATATEQVEATQTEVQPEATTQEQTAAPATKKETSKATTNTTTKAPAAKEETKQPAVDPCEAKIAAFEQFANDLAEAKKANGTAKGARAYADLAKQVSTQRANIKDCNNATGVLKTRLTNAQAKITRTIN
ncbi:MAG: hypothetical protein Q4Q06_06085 [Bacteroidota bacterium]|nr:hypothetical protein [Bacteroidota bacterium]